MKKVFPGLLTALCGTFVLLCNPVATAQPADSPHPAVGLLFDESDLPAMRANAELPVFKAYWDDVLSKDVQEDKDFMREAFAYLMTGDAERGERAKKLVLETAEMTYWNNFVDGDLPLGFLQAGRLTAWMALSYDWLYDILTEEERETVRTAIAEKGCVPLYRALHGMRYPETVTGWAFAPYTVIEPRSHIDMTRWPHILGHNNFRAIINGGLTLGLLAVEGHDDRVETWKEMVLDSIHRFNDLFKDDGSYEEAVAYLNYAMTYEVYAMEAARRHLGVNYFDSANFTGMIDYVLAMYLPSTTYGHGSLTFGDAGNSLHSAATFWVARNARDGEAQYVGLNYSEHDLFSLLYYDPTLPPVAPGPDGYLVELDLDWISSRSGYELDDFVVGMRSGGPSNHEHGDRNSIQLKAYGEILLADHKRLNYWPVDPEWMMRTSLGHNTVLIDGVGHQYHHGEEGTNESKSYAKIMRSGSRKGYHFWASDATPGYKLLNADVVSVTRSLVSFPSAPAIVVMDRIATTKPSLVSGRWHIENFDGGGSIDLGDESFTIQRPTARMYAVVAGDATQKLATGMFGSEHKEHPYRWVEVSDAEKSTDSFRLMVGVPLRAGEPDPQISFDRDGTQWTIRIDKLGSVIELLVFDQGVLPEFEVVRNDF